MTPDNQNHVPQDEQTQSVQPQEQKPRCFKELRQKIGLDNVFGRTLVDLYMEDR